MKSWLTVFISGVLGLHSVTLSAAYWVDNFTGSGHYQRNDKILPIQNLMNFNHGDTILRLPESTELPLLNSDNTVFKTLTHDNTPFTISATEKVTWINDALAYLQKWWSERINSQTEPVPFYGRAFNQLAFLGTSARVNRLLAGQTQLHLHWHNLPHINSYQLELLDRYNQLVEPPKRIGQSPFVWQLEKPLPAGQYILKITHPNGKQHSRLRLAVMQNYRLSNPDLQRDLSRLLQTSMPTAVKQQYLALLLSQDSQWWLQAQQICHQAGLDKLLAYLYSKERPHP